MMQSLQPVSIWVYPVFLGGPQTSAVSTAATPRHLPFVSSSSAGSNTARSAPSCDFTETVSPNKPKSAPQAALLAFPALQTKSGPMGKKCIPSARNLCSYATE